MNRRERLTGEHHFMVAADPLPLSPKIRANQFGHGLLQYFMSFNKLNTLLMLHTCHHIRFFKRQPACNIADAVKRGTWMKSKQKSCCTECDLGFAMVCHIDNPEVGLRWFGRTSRWDIACEQSQFLWNIPRAWNICNIKPHGMNEWDITLVGLTSLSSFIVLSFGLLPT